MTDEDFVSDYEYDYSTSRREALRRMIEMLRGKSWVEELFKQPPHGYTAVPPGREEEVRIEKDAYWRKQLGTALEDARQGKFGRAERDRHREPEPKRWSFCCTLFDATDREFRAPPRIHIRTPWRFITIALGPHGTVSGTGGRGRHFIRFDRYNRDLCFNVVAIQTQGEFIKGFRVCPLKKRHKDGCLDWKSFERVSRPFFEEVK